MEEYVPWVDNRVEIILRWLLVEIGAELSLGDATFDLLRLIRLIIRLRCVELTSTGSLQFLVVALGRTHLTTHGPERFHFDMRTLRINI